MSLHAHVNTESRDCDGRYDRSYVLVADEGETFSDFWKWNRENRGEGTTFTDEPGGFSFYTSTDEGYVAGDVTFCTEDDMEDDSNYSFRDYTAEAAGY